MPTYTETVHLIHEPSSGEYEGYGLYVIGFVTDGTATVTEALDVCDSPISPAALDPIRAELEAALISEVTSC